MSEPRKQHIVPQFYLKGFARRTRNRWYAVVLNRATGDGGLRNVRDIFAERDYNTIVDADGSRDFGAESLLAEHIEATSQPVVDSLRDGTFPLKEDDRGELAVFMSVQLTRGRVIRSNLERTLSDMMSQAVGLAAQNASDEQWLEATGEIPSPEMRRRLVMNRKHMIIQPTKAWMLRTLFAPVEEIAGMLFNRTWTLAEFARPCLLSGENPVVAINPTGSPIGYGVATAERLYLPVSTCHALVLSLPWSGWPEAIVAGTDELAERLNWAMLSYPSNNELLLDPDVARHPLPGVAPLAANPHWPWGPDPESAAPVFMEYASGLASL